MQAISKNHNKEHINNVAVTFQKKIVTVNVMHSAFQTKFLDNLIYAGSLTCGGAYSRNKHN